jgi:mono/diheme cytochrome c family protein
MKRTTVSAAAAIVAAVAVFAVFLALDDGRGDDARTVTAQASPSDGRAVFARMGCGSCHRLSAAGSTGEIGPDLDAALAGQTRASLEDAILLRPARTRSMMPDDYASRMSDAELDALVSFLLAARPDR